VTDGLPALALATDPIDPDVLTRPPRGTDSPFTDRRLVTSILVTAALTAGVTFGTFVHELQSGAHLQDARNAAFSVLTFAELLRALGARSETRSIWQLGLFSNLRLFAVVAGSFALQLAIHFVEPLEAIFQTEPIGLTRCLEWVMLGAIPLAVLELAKLARASQLGGKSFTSSGPR
jgi:Ca2+-transporting ATPase